MVLYCMHLTRIEWDVREYKRNCNRSLDREKEEKLEDTKGGNQKSLNEVQTIQWPNKKTQKKHKQWSRNHYTVNYRS